MTKIFPLPYADLSTVKKSTNIKSNDEFSLNIPIYNLLSLNVHDFI